MKKQIATLLVIFLFISCTIFNSCSNSVSKDDEFKRLLSNEGYDNADIVTVKKTFVPDSLRPAMAVWITETVRAASYHLTTCDYEDPEDVIKQTVKSANEVFARTFEFEGIRFYKYEYIYDICYNDLTNGQKKIFDYLKNKK